MSDKKSWYKRWWAILIWIMLGLVILGNFVEETPNDNSKIETSQNNEVRIYDKSLVDMMPKRNQIPTEFRMEDPFNKSIADPPNGYNSGLVMSASKIVGSTGYGVIVVDFDIMEFDTEEGAKAFHDQDTTKIKNEGGYTEYSIKVPSGAQCFSFLQDYGFSGSFATANCQSGNIAYQVIVTVSQTTEKPEKYLKPMVFALDENIHN